MWRALTTTFIAAAVLGTTAGPVSAIGERSRSSVIVESTSFGRILFDGGGFVLYGFTRDPRDRSTCTRDCAKAWPPFVVKSRPRPAADVDEALLGTVKRADGSLQATYAGRPLYYYVGDRKPGQILCQNVTEFGGVWRVIRPDGRLVG